MRRLDFVDNSFILVEPIPHARMKVVRAYYRELSDRLKQIRDYWRSEADTVLFRHFEPYYQAIANHLNPAFNVAPLTPESRHSFFVATEPVVHPESPELSVPGLSLLEQMMGFSYRAQPQSRSGGPPEVRITTGDNDDDLTVDVFLTFKHQAAYLLEHYDSATLGKMVEQACNRLRGDAALREKQAESDRAWFAKHEEQIYQQAIGYGIPVIHEVKDGRNGNN